MGIGEVTADTARAVFLDRDGVLNDVILRDGKPYPPSTVSELSIVPQACDTLARLKQMGFVLIVVSNQPDVARGAQTREAVEAINAIIRAKLPIDAILTCYHDDSDGCACRKPKPGLLLRGIHEFKIDPRMSYMIGDRWRDIDAGASIGCRTVWIDNHYRERGPSSPPDARVFSLSEAAEWIMSDCAVEVRR